MLRRTPSKCRAATRAAPTKTSRDLNVASPVGAPLMGALPLPSAPTETSRHVHDASLVGAPLVGALPLTFALPWLVGPPPLTFALTNSAGDER